MRTTLLSISSLLLLLGFASRLPTTASDSAIVESPSSELEFVVYDNAVLKAIKNSIADGSVDKARLNTLIAIADEQLSIPFVSVMDKPLVPPSGDKHDYLTRAIYFWPNPDTEDGLPFVKRDGVTYEVSFSQTDRPLRNVMDERVLRLGLAYYLTGNEAYATNAIEQIRIWFINPATRMNPHMKYSQGVPGIMDGSEWGSIDNWRWPQLLDSITMLRTSAEWTEADQAAIEAWFGQYRHWLETSPLGERYDLMWNNHATFYDAQRASIAIFTGQRDDAREILKESWHRRIDHGIEGDGRQRYELERTRSFAYSNFNLRAYMTLAAIGDNVGLDLWNHTAEDGSSIRKAIDYLAPYADQSIEWPHLDIRFSRSEIRPTLHWAAIVYGDDSYRQRITGLEDYDQLRGVPSDRGSDLYQIFLDP